MTTRIHYSTFPTPGRIQKKALMTRPTHSRIHIDRDIDMQKVVDPPSGSIIYTIGVLESIIGGSIFPPNSKVWGSLLEKGNAPGWMGGTRMGGGTRIPARSAGSVLDGWHADRSWAHAACAISLTEATTQTLTLPESAGPRHREPEAPSFGAETVRAPNTP